MTTSHETPWAALPPGPHGTPSPALAERHQDQPVAPVIAPSGDPVLMAVGYDDVQEVLRCPYSSRQVTAPGLPRLIKDYSIDDLPGVLVNMDDPDHARQRRLMRGAFTVAQAEHWRPTAAAIARELLDAVDAEMDIVEQYALPLSSRVICHVLGVPSNDYEAIHEWSSTFLTASDASTQARAEAYDAFMEYAAALVSAHRDNPGKNLLDMLIHARDDGDHLDEIELVNLVFALMVAGHETTAMMIARGTYRLLLHPDQYRLLVDDPSLLPAAVEEILRYDGPGSPGLLRHLTHDLRLPSGTVLAAGTVILPNLIAANHDPAAFHQPEVFDIRRYENGPARGHLAFGHGSHYCLGAVLARVELQEALRALINRAPSLRPAIALADVPWTREGVTHQPVQLPVLLTGADKIASPPTVEDVPST